MRFFFYGTLIDPEVRTAVMGRDAVDGSTVAPAVVHGWRAVFVQGRPYPAAMPRRGHDLRGILVDGVPERLMPRLSAYEGPEYVARIVKVETVGHVSDGDAFVFVAGPECRLSASPWRFADWERRHKRRFLAGVRASRLA